MDAAFKEQMREAHQWKVDGIIDTPTKAQLQSGIINSYYGRPATSCALARVCNGLITSLCAHVLCESPLPHEGRVPAAADTLTRTVYILHRHKSQQPCFSVP